MVDVGTYSYRTSLVCIPLYMHSAHLAVISNNISMPYLGSGFEFLRFAWKNYARSDQFSKDKQRFKTCKKMCKKCSKFSDTGTNQLGCFSLSESKAPIFPKILGSHLSELLFAWAPISPNSIIGEAPISPISAVLLNGLYWPLNVKILKKVMK